MTEQRVYTMLDLRLGLVKYTPEQQAQIARVIPIFALAGIRALRRADQEERRSDTRRPATT